MNRIARTVSVALAVALLASACGSGGSAAVSSVIGGGTRSVVAVDKRGTPLQLSGTTLEGKPLNLASYRGKPVVLNIWGSWCPPCRSEAPEVEAAATRLAGTASFVGIDTRETAAAPGLAYQRRFRITYPSLLDDGSLLLALHGADSAQSPPVTVVLDAQGRIAGRFVGPVTTLTLVDMVHDVLASA